MNAEADDVNRHLSLAEAKEKLESHGYPGSNPQIAVGHFHAVLDCYKEIRQHGQRDDGQLLGNAPSPTVNKPEEGLYVEQVEWLENVAKPALNSLPDIRPPDGWGSGIQSWRYVGERNHGETTRVGHGSGGEGRRP